MRPPHRPAPKNLSADPGVSITEGRYTAAVATDAIDELLEVCESYLAEYAGLLRTLHRDQDFDAFTTASQARLDQLVTAVRCARAQRTRPRARSDPGE